MQNEPERNSVCEIIEKHATSKGFLNIRCYIMTDKNNGSREYAICDDKDWIYANPLAEAVWAHIDMMYLVENMK
jgi:hypothetical protein